MSTTPSSMTVPELLAELSSRGVELRVDGHRLLYRPKEAVPARLVAQLRSHKASLLAILAGALDTSEGTKTPEPIHPEVERFCMVAKPWPGGRGWYDPQELPVLEAIQRAAAPTHPRAAPARQGTLYEVDGKMMSFVERAEYYRKNGFCNSKGVM